MAIKFVKEKRKQKYLILIFIIVLLAIGAVWYFGYFREEKSITQTVETAPKEVRINLNLLGGQEIKSFQFFREIIPFKGKTGRENPFLSY